MSSSLSQLVPKSIFDQTVSSNDDIPITEPLGRQLVEVVLTQLRIAMDASSLESVLALQKEADEKIRKELRKASIPASSLHQFVTSMLRLSKDPRKTPIAFRLFSIAFGVDPIELNDPTTSSSVSATGELDTSLASVPIAGVGAWGINAAGYSWASMVLSGQAPPPPGIHLLTRGSQEYVAAVAKQQGAAIRVYATLAMRGDAQGMLGMGRVLMAGTQRKVPVPGKSGVESDREVEIMKDRTIALWTKAGQMGVGDAWFELGILYLGTTTGFKVNEEKSRGYFELGAKEGNFRSHHALGVMHTQAAMADNKSPSSSERNEHLSKSLHHFTSAAELGDPQSAHNVGLRYLLRDEMVNEIALGKDNDGRSDLEVLQQSKARHQSLWGAEADDVKAKHWFARAAELGSIPAMMNYAGMLVEGRGADTAAPAPQRTPAVTSERDATQLFIQSRIKDLQTAESLYSRVATHGSVIAQQQVQASSSGGKAKQGQADQPKEASVGQEMANFAQEALGTVQSMMREILEEADKTSNKTQNGKP
ncbi:hypothetical protein CBS101457_003392 [Exobasidium rhododendri]|nr:hypothetical protein CBS101457_003392 [Exobasidium rhododendri]